MDTEKLRLEIPKKYLSLPALFSYSLITLLIWNATEINTHTYAGDFQLYFQSGHNLIGDRASELSNKIYQELIINNNLQSRYEGWVPNPIYTILVIISINLLGSKVIFSLLGLTFGILNIFLVNKLLLKFKNNNIFSLNNISIILITFLYAIYPENITNSVYFSVSCIYSTFILLALLNNSIILRTILGILAISIRPDSIYLIIALLFTYIFIYKKFNIKNNPLRVILIFLLSYLFFYFLYHGTYPGQGNPFTYFISPLGMGLPDKFINYGLNLIDKSFDLDLINILRTKGEVEFFNIDYPIIEILKKWIFDPEAHNYLFQLTILRFQTLLGYSQSDLPTTNVFNIWYSSALRTLYFFFLYLPGFLIAIKDFLILIYANFFSNNKRPKNHLKIRYFLSITVGIYIILHSLTVCVPRYLLPLNIILILLIFDNLQNGIRFNHLNDSAN